MRGTNSETPAVLQDIFRKYSSSLDYQGLPDDFEADLVTKREKPAFFEESEISHNEYSSIGEDRERMELDFKGRRESEKERVRDKEKKERDDREIEILKEILRGKEKQIERERDRETLREREQRERVEREREQREIVERDRGRDPENKGEIQSEGAERQRDMSPIIKVKIYIVLL